MLTMSGPISELDRPAGPALIDLRPMLMTEAREPWLDPTWLCEPMANGDRVRAEVVGDHVELRSRDGEDVTGWYPELRDSLRGLTPTRTVIDGEVCMLDDSGRCDIARLLSRRRGPNECHGPASFIVFDVLVHRGRDVRMLGLVHRKDLLRRLFTKRRPCVLRCLHAPGDQPVELYNLACELKLQGIVMKRLNSPYACGQRTGDWVKIPCNGPLPESHSQHGALTLG